jgi:hypothetical protein
MFKTLSNKYVEQISAMHTENLCPASTELICIAICRATYLMDYDFKLTALTPSFCQLIIMGNKRTHHTFCSFNIVRT